ncbi:hypothetical protein N7486_002263 [Penicillium sp. IBT 16267x]|nr:hypothetical protein N7486_002263 [Penicillium sp. IBT 16267x]
MPRPPKDSPTDDAQNVLDDLMLDRTAFRAEHAFLESWGHLTPAFQKDLIHGSTSDAVMTRIRAEAIDGKSFKFFIDDDLLYIQGDDGAPRLCIT